MYLFTRGTHSYIREKLIQENLFQIGYNRIMHTSLVTSSSAVMPPRGIKSGKNMNLQVLKTKKQKTSQNKPIVKPLAAWTKKIHCLDCIKLMQELPTESVSVVVTSPPYNLKNSTGNGMKDGRGGKWSNAGLINGYANYNDCLPHEDYARWQRACLTEMMRVLRPDGAIFYNHKWRVQDGILQDRSDIVSGFPVRQIIIWKRKGGFNFNAGYFLPTYEVIYLIAKPEFRLVPKANAQGDVWEIPQARDNEHPAPFPVELAQRCISSTMGGVVLDPFMGSGTTAIASEVLNREWIGIELSRDYCKMAEGRLKKYRETNLS